MAETKIVMGPQSNKADLHESFQWIEDGAAVVLTGGTINFAANDPDTGARVLDASTDDGKITISTTTLTIDITAEELSDLDPKEYNIGCRITVDDFRSQLFHGTLSLYEGEVDV